MAIKHLRSAFFTHFQPDQAAHLSAGDSLREPGGDYEGLHKQMKRLFNSKPGKKYGRFSEDLGECPLSAWLKDYLEDRPTFGAMTDRLFGQWQELLTGRQEEFDGPLMLLPDHTADTTVG